MPLSKGKTLNSPYESVFNQKHAIMKIRNLFSLLVVAASVTLATAQPKPRHTLCPTPPMGWMTWNLFQGNINEQLIRETADAMVEGGFRDAGYKYIFIDDIWQGGRDSRNNIIPDPAKFPSGIRALADYVHAKGLKLGIYSDAAQLTCAGFTASLGFEEQDARTFASWGIDYLKYDYCDAPEDSATARKRYRTMADALSRSGRDIVLGVCEWGQRNAEDWCAQVGGQLWRTSYDVRDMWKDIVHRGGMGIIDIVNVTAPIASKTGKTQWPDMDMLVVGLNGKGGPSSQLGGVGCSYTEYQTQMSMWCMLASPLTMSNDLRKLTEEDKRILLNAEAIAIDQDELASPAERKVMTDERQVFVRALSGGRHAVAIINTADTKQQVNLPFASVGLDKAYAVRDVWQHKTIASHAKKWKGVLQPHETVLLVLSE